MNNISKEEREQWIYDNAAFKEDAFTEEEAKEASADDNNEEE